MAHSFYFRRFVVLHVALARRATGLDGNPKERATAPSILLLVFCFDNRIPLGVSIETAFKTWLLESGHCAGVYFSWLAPSTALQWSQLSCFASDCTPRQANRRPPVFERFSPSGSGPQVFFQLSFQDCCKDALSTAQRYFRD